MNLISPFFNPSRRRRSLSFPSRVGGMTIKAPVPDDHPSRTVIALRDNPLEIFIIERVVFHHHGQPFYGRIQRDALRDRPALQHPLHLEPEIVMEGTGRVLLDDKNEAFPPATKRRLRFRGLPEFPFEAMIFPSPYSLKTCPQGIVDSGLSRSRIEQFILTLSDKLIYI